jgi:hypothetical protein
VIELEDLEIRVERDQGCSDGLLARLLLGERLTRIQLLRSAWALRRAAAAARGSWPG